MDQNGANDLGFVMPSQVEESDLEHQLQPSNGQIYDENQEEYDELNDVIDGEAMWTNHNQTNNIPLNVDGNSMRKSAVKHIYTTVVGEIPTTHIGQC
jgi:hypothetical protein